MKNRRLGFLAVLVTTAMLAGLVGTADAHLRRRNGERVTRKHARMHRQQLPAAGSVATADQLKAYSATVDGTTLQELVDQGYDVTPEEQTREGTQVTLVLSQGEKNALNGKGISTTFVSAGREREGFSAAVADESIYGWDVFRSYDEPGGIEDQIRAIASRPQNQGFTKLYDIGNTLQGRDILAIRMTQGARGLPLGQRPAVLYQGTTHAREWISTEVDMRLLKWFVAERRAENPQIVELLETTELWFVPVVNPDGYEYTFTTERLWRKNLRNNDDDPEITNSDGVDLNRNYREHWNYDDEGSDSQISSQTYRGTAPGSEPESSADMNLVENMGDFKFAISYHSFGELLLYTQGWQTLTPSADDPIYVALSGTDDDPAIDGFNPGVGADLYTTNGEFTDWAHGEQDVLAWTPELSEGCDGCQFEFPDNEALVQEEFEKNIPFALNVAKSAGDPDDPESHTGLDTAGLYVNESEIDPWKSNWPTSDLRVLTSYAGGSSQPVEVLAKKAIGDVTLNYSINGDPAATAETSLAPAGEVYSGNGAYDEYYQYLRGEIPELEEGDSVEYWFTGGGESTEHVTFDVVGDATADVLVVAAEDRTGASPVYPAPTTDPFFLSYYTAAIADAGRTVEVYDVDAMGRTAPDHTGVLNHYDAVVWYTGNDVVTREPGWGAGNVSRLAVDLVLQNRAYLNEGGNLMYTGQAAGFIESSGQQQFYDPVANQRCRGAGVPPEVGNRCLLWGDKNDFLQYYLGAYLRNNHAGAPTGVEGTDAPYSGMNLQINGPGTANNQSQHASFITTSTILPPSEYPQFTSDARANYPVAGGAPPFEPFHGDWYMYSQQADISYKRLGRTFNVPATGGEMSFRISYDTEHDWDFVFVEVHTLAQDGTPIDDWTTLEDLNGHNSQSTGPNDADLASCPAGWHELHPHLAHYQDWDGVETCTPEGTTGEWWANSGRSQGWEEWRVDLGDYAGKTIEIFISYASDWAVQGLGSFVDSVQMPGEPVESFETGLGAWSESQPPDSDPNPNNWLRTESVGFEEGAIVSLTPPSADFKTLYWGFGFEAIQGATGPNSRADAMNRSLDFFGV